MVYATLFPPQTELAVGEKSTLFFGSSKLFPALEQNPGQLLSLDNLPLSLSSLDFNEGLLLLCERALLFVKEHCSLKDSENTNGQR